MSKSLSILIIIAFSVQVVGSMEIIRENKSEKALCALLENSWHCFGHKDLNNFAKVNTALRKSVLNTATKMKDPFFKSFGYFVEQRENKNVIKLWNPYATVCSVIALEYNTLYLRQYSLNNNRQLSLRLGAFDNIESILDLSIVKPRVTKNNCIQVYGCGYSSLRDKQQIFEYTLAAMGMRSQKKCEVNIDGKNKDMINFMYSFSLLAQLFNSKKIEEKALSKIYYYNEGSLQDDKSYHNISDILNQACQSLTKLNEDFIRLFQ